MKILVFGDIHGNIYVLDELLSIIKNNKFDYIFFTGDIMGYYYHQIRVINRMKKIADLISVLGNHDKLYIEGANQKEILSRLSRRYGKSYIKLFNNYFVKNYLNMQYEKIDITINGKRIILTHGNIEDNLNGRVYPDDHVSEVKDIDYVIMGHTHYKLDKKIGRTRWINPGSLGQPRDGGLPSYCIIDVDSDSVKFKSIDYNKTQLLNDIKRYDADNKYLTSILFRRNNNE